MESIYLFLGCSMVSAIIGINFRKLPLIFTTILLDQIIRQPLTNPLLDEAKNNNTMVTIRNIVVLIIATLQKDKTPISSNSLIFIFPEFAQKLKIALK